MHQLRIQSDGTGPYTVITTESGEKIEAREATISLGYDKTNRVDLLIFMPILDVYAYAGQITFTCPVCSTPLYHTCDELEIKIP